MLSSINMISFFTAFIAATAASPLFPRDTAQTPDLNFRSGCMTSYNNISFGWLPDDAAGLQMSTLNADTGKKACMYGYYMQFGTDYNDDQLTGRMSDVVNSGAVFVPAIMPTGLTFSQIDSNMAQNIANTVKKFTDQGVMVFLRFAHEMNYYTQPDAQPHYPGGTTDEFVQAWKNVHAAVAGNPKCLMFWSPNSDSSDNLQAWYPGADYVDIVGMDVYPSPGSDFSSIFSDFYDAFPKASNKHFILGETGSKSSAVNDKEDWLAQVTSADYSAFPYYQGAAWFEYDKGGQDFRVIYGQSSSTVTETLSNFQ